MQENKKQKIIRCEEATILSCSGVFIIFNFLRLVQTTPPLMTLIMTTIIYQVLKQTVFEYTKAFHVL